MVTKGGKFSQFSPKARRAARKKFCIKYPEKCSTMMAQARQKRDIRRMIKGKSPAWRRAFLRSKPRVSKQVRMFRRRRMRR